MALKPTKIKHKRSSVAGKKPIVSQLESGEIAINTADGKIFLLKDDNTVQDLTQKIFENNTKVEVNDPGDSQGTITATVDGSEKIIITNSTINIYEDVDMENATGITFRELTASGDDGITVKAPDNLPSSYTLNLPLTTGTFGQFIRTDGTGQLEFVNADIFGGNVIYVSAEQGDDVNDGQSAPVKTVKRACQLASALVYNANGTPNGTRINIKVAVGDYTEQNPIIVPDNVVIKGDSLRGCIIRPANANQDMLRVRNACYFGDFTFRDGVDTNFVPLITFDYAVAFDDPEDTATSRVGYTNLPETRPTITTSPYIQNCSIISFLGGNGVEIDGTKVNSPNVPINAIEAENPVFGAIPEQGKSMVANAFTHISFGGTGWRLTNDAYAQIVSCFQIFLLNGIYCQSGGYCSITNSATNFGLYALRASGFSPRAFLFDRAYVYGTGLSEGSQTLSIVGINRETPVEEYIIKFRNPEYRYAHNTLIENRIAIAEDTVTWVNSEILAATPGSIWYNYTYNESSLYNNILLLVEAVAKDTWDTGNRYTRSAGLAFYNKNLQDSSEILIPGEIEQTIAAIEQASVYAATYITALDSEIRSFVDEKFDVVKTIINDPDDIPDATEVSAEGDVTNLFKPVPTVTSFDGAIDINASTDIFTIVGHGFTNRQKLVYNPNGNVSIRGLDPEQTYYVSVINNDEFSLTFDEGGDFAVNITQASTGTHQFLSNIQEFFVDEILSSHSVYQTLILESGAESYEFVPGRSIAGTTSTTSNSAIVFSWEPSLRRLVVSVEEVSIGSDTVRNQFNETSIIANDHSAIPNTVIGINEVSARTGLTTATFSIEGTADGAVLSNLINLPETQIWFHRPSIVNSSSHTWEYAGSGTDYNALPQNGGNTRDEFEQFSELPGRVYSSGTNELGDFKVGNFITAFNRTGNITFRNKVQVEELDALRLSLSNVAIEEISTNVNLGDNEIGGPRNTRLSTQLAVRSFLSNRLGGFIDKTVSTASVPGAIVQLNTNGQLNADLIPATRQFTNTNTPGYLSRLDQVDEIPAVDLKAGDIATEEYEQIELTFASPISANDGDLIEQAVTGARGYAKGSYNASLNLLVASIGGEFKAGDDSTGTDFDTTNTISIEGVSTGQAPSALGSSSAIIDNYFLRSSNTSQYLLLDPTELHVFTSDTITTVSRSSNVATITTASVHNLNAGNNVQVLCNEDTTFNVNGIVLSTPTTSSFTIANTGSNTTSTSVTGTARSIVTSADSNAQGAVTEVRYGILSNVDNANITGGSGYTPLTGTLTYANVPLSNITGVGTGAVADVTVTGGQVVDVDLRRGGTGYAVGDIVHVDSNLLGDDSAGNGFEIEVVAVESRAYVNILGGELFVASASSIDFVEDNDAVTNKISVTLTDTISNNFLAGSDGAGGSVDYIAYRIAITAHGLTSGDPVTYNTLGNVAIGGLLNGSVYYAKKITNDVIELYEDYALLNQVEFLSTPANNNHNITRFNVNITDNSLIVPAHGLTTGDAIRIVGSDLFEVSSTGVPSGSRFFVGSITTNSFTIHELRSDALSSINGLVTNARNLTAVGTGTAEYIPNNVQVSGIINTSSRIKVNWNSLAATNIDASNIISGTVSPSRLASSGVANTDTFLRGDSSYQVVVQKLKKANTTDNPITLTGSNIDQEFYGSTVNIGISNVVNSLENTYSTLGVARFLQSQFDVDADGNGQVFIKNGVVDAGTLDNLDSSYFLNPGNLTSPVPVSRGGTNLTTYAVGDIVYASSTGTLNTLNIGRKNSILKSSGTIPEWGTALDISEGLDVGSANLTSSSTGIGQLYNSNVTTLELGSNAENVKIGKSTATRSIASFVSNYDATISQNVVVNLASFTKTTNAIVPNGGKEVPMANTSGILSGMIVTGSASIPANTTVSGVTPEFIYLSNATTGTITSSTTLTFTYTPLTIGVRAGDTVNIASSTISNLDGTWSVTGATANATSFTIQTDANVTADPLNAAVGTITKNNTIVFRNRTAIFGSAEGSSSPVAATLRGEDAIGTDTAGGDFVVQAGLSTGNATGGSFVVKTGTTNTSSDFKQTPSTRLTIDTEGNAAFTTNVSVAGNISLPDNSTINVGTGNDLQIYHDGNNSYIDDAGTGILAIRSNSVRLQKYTGEEMLHADADGAVTLYHNNAAKLATTATGISVTGDVAAATLNTTGDVVVGGNFTVNGTTVTINATELSVDDINIVLGATESPSDTTANGGGITLQGTTDKTISWINATAAWTASEHWNLASGKEFRIGGTSMLNSTTLGSTVVTSSLQSLGTVTSGSIASGFGNINIGTNTFTGNGSGLTTLNATNLSSGTVAGARLGGNQTMEGVKTFSNTTNSSSTTTGAVVVGGGVGIANNLHVGGTITGNGSGLTDLDATNLSSGTVPNARITGTYSNITGTGALDAGSITGGFGNINIGTSTFTGNGSGLTSVNAATLDSIDSTSFVRSDDNDTVTGLINISRTGEMLQLSDTIATGSPFIGFYQGAERRGYIQMLNGGTMRIASDQHSSRLDVGDGINGLTYTDGTTWTVWHSGNDGSGSGLDADTVDGIQGTSFLRSDENDTFSGTLSGAGSINITGTITATAFTGSGSGLTDISATTAAITSGTINGTTIGATTPSTIAGTTGSFSSNLSVTGTLTVSGNASFNSTGAVKLSAGTVAQRPTGVAGQIRFNSDTGQFEGYNGSAWGNIGGGLAGGGSDSVFLENDQTITTNYSISENKNALTVGPVEINSGVTVTVPATSRWVIL